MAELLTAAQMRAIERAAIDSGQVTGLELMERAGRGVVEAILEEWPEFDRSGRGASPASLRDGALPLREHEDALESPGYLEQENEQALRAVVLCGPGNNGGDGFVVARLLKELGWAVEVFLYGDADKLPPDARVNYERWCRMGEVHDFLTPLSEFPQALHELGKDDAGVVVDALFGTGLKRAMSREVGLRLSDFRSIVPICILNSVAVDVPSGLCCDSGKWLLDQDGLETGQWVDLCVSFHRAKLGHVLGQPYIKKLAVKSIGLDELRQNAFASDAADMFQALSGMMSAEGGRDRLLELLRQELDGNRGERLAELPSEVECVAGITDEIEKHSGHKFSHGHALILAGGAGKGGAARLAGRGALRVGAGLVTLAPTPGALQENAARLDAVMLAPVGDGAALQAVLSDARINALCLGPGLGQERAREMVPVALAAKRATVLDADALSAYAEAPEVLFEMLHGNCVLTPHGGEFARLFPDIAEKLNAPAVTGPAYSKVDATREAAARAGCVVLFKGADTVIAGPDGRCSIHSAAYDRAAPWLATAGSGDVLAGFITGLLARRHGPHWAAGAGAWLHVECARAFGPGLIAEDLPEMLPQVFRALGVR